MVVPQNVMAAEWQRSPKVGNIEPTARSRVRTDPTATATHFDGTLEPVAALVRQRVAVPHAPEGSAAGSLGARVAVGLAIPRPVKETRIRRPSSGAGVANYILRNG